MSKVDQELLHLENEMKSIQESGSLFEVTVPEFKLLKQCRKELRMLKVRCIALFYEFNIILYILIIKKYFSNCGTTRLLLELVLKIGKLLHGEKLMLKTWILNVKSLLKKYVC